MQIEASNQEHLPYFYRGFMQKNEERVDEKSLALYEEEAIVVLQKSDCSKWVIEGNFEGNFNDIPVIITINKMFEFKYNISQSNFEIVLDISNGQKISQLTNFLSEKYNVLEFKIVGYGFSKNKFISINKITQSL